MAIILIVDDEASILMALRKILEKFGHEVVDAKDGTEALEKYRDATPDVVITDLYMPGVDGMETIIRLMAESPDAKIIAMSGGGWQTKGVLLDNMSELGVAATLAKPFTVSEVVGVVAKVLKEDG